MKVIFRLRKPLGSSVLLCCLIALQSCVVVNPKPALKAVDTSVVTGSLPANVLSPVNNGALADQKIIRDQVVAAALGGRVEWANSQTGSRGVITSIAESRDNGHACRSFQTTREAFDGIMMYSGKTCEISDGIWAMHTFDAR